MKTLLLTMPVFFLSLVIHWENNIEKAKEVAKSEHKYILLNFSGSDWCGPCIRLHKEVFESDAFAAFAATHLVMVNADFPRQKKNQLPKVQQQQNDKLADKYDPTGSFPYTLLLDENGTVIKKWDGYPDGGTTQFINEIKSAIHVTD